MDTLLHHPAHTLLGVTTESPAKGRTKVLIAALASLLLGGVMLAEDLNVFQYSKLVISQKMQKNRRLRRISTARYQP